MMRVWMRRLAGWPAELAGVLFLALAVASVLGFGMLSSTNWPTGGDAASHLLYVWLYANDLFFAGQVTPWVPEVFGGFPFLSYYFPLPFIVMAGLAKAVGVAPAFKWGGFLACMLLPGVALVMGRRALALPWPAAVFGALGALAFVLHEQNSIWGGNLLSTLAGEFAYSYGVLFALAATLAWARAAHLGRGWLIAALLEAACGFSHGFPLLVVGFSTLFLLAEASDRRRVFTLLAAGHTLAFCLLGGWLWPMIEMHGLTIPNDAAFPLSSWRDLLPATLWPAYGAGLVGLAFMAVPAVRAGVSDLQAAALRYLLASAALAAVGFVAGDQLGLADIRFFPLTWLFGAVASGWLAGLALTALARIRRNPAESRGAEQQASAGKPGPARKRSKRRDATPTAAAPAVGSGDLSATATERALGLGTMLIVAAATLGLFGWFGIHVKAAPDWSLWNHSGLDAKPQWHNLSRLLPSLAGSLWSPRLVFEHDPDNNDIGSTRTLEALPMFLGHRPVLEGLYMESALLGPAIYQLQSELSARPSSPLVRFPSGSLDADFAARHMNFLHADTALLRSEAAKRAVEASGLFVKLAESPPFAVYRLRDFDSRLIDVVRQPLQVRPEADGMQDAFAWFRTRSRFAASLPVYGAPQELAGPASATVQRIVERRLDRHGLHFETEAVGQPHLLKIAWHPRWKLRSQGQIYRAGPGFMLVVPQEKDIRLEYGHTAVGVAGMAASILALMLLLGYGRRWMAWEGWHGARETVPSRDGRWVAVGLSWVALALAGVWFALHAPERVYNRAWEAMRANRYAVAADDFAVAYERRRPPSKKEEALFWSAKASELAGRKDEAAQRYRELIDRYHGYWLPESLYTYVTLERAAGRSAAAESFSLRLREEYPNNTWTKRLPPLQ